MILVSKQTMSSIICQYCHKEGHNIQSGCDVLRQKNKNKRQLREWVNLVKRWGSNHDAMDEFYEKGDEVYGIGFKNFLETMNLCEVKVIQDSSHKTTDNMFAGLEQETTKEPNYKHKQIDIVKNEEAQFWKQINIK